MKKNDNVNSITTEIRIRRCYGCGAPLQADNPALTGFLSKELLVAEEVGLCERCFRLQHYNEFGDTPKFNNDYIKILETARKEGSLIVLVLDVFAFEASIIKDIGKYIGDKAIVLLNKRDILPKTIADEKIIGLAKARLKQENIKPAKIMITSQAKNINVDELIELINKERHGKNIYFVGTCSVGKSSLINSFLKVYKNETKHVISTSTYPGTTLDVIAIPLDEKSYIYDTPGIFNDESIINHVERQILKFIVPRNEIKPRMYQLSPEQSLIIGGIAKFDFVTGGKSNFCVYLSNDIDVTRSKLEKSPTTFANIIKEKNTTPVSITINTVEDLVTSEFTLPDNKVNNRIIIIGLGYIEVLGTGQLVKISVPKGVKTKVVTLG